MQQHHDLCQWQPEPSPLRSSTLRRSSKKINWSSTWLHPSTWNWPRHFQSTEDKRKNTKQTLLEWNKHHQVEVIDEFMRRTGTALLLSSRLDRKAWQTKGFADSSPAASSAHKSHAAEGTNEMEDTTDTVRVSGDVSSTVDVSWFTCTQLPKEADKSSHQET